MQKVVNELWQWLREEYMVERVGVMLTDSKTTPMRWGVVGTCIASCGFEVLRSYIGTEDIFGYIMKMEQTNVAEGIAAAAVLEMGEGAERQPLAVVSEVGEINFMDRVPSEQELETLKIAKEDDFFEPMLKKIEWKKGRARY
jgi:F420-0:gamma-glutamyl ligase